MHVRLRFVLCVLAAALLFAAPSALASGFAVSEQGAKASGQAVAFVARADDASAVWYNPAAITKLEGNAASLGFSLVFLGDTTFTSRMDDVDPVLFEGGRFDMIDNTATPAHAFFVYHFEDSPWSLGFGVTTPFGLVTEWGESFDGRFSARKSDLAVLVYNLNAAVDVGGGWSLAFGLDYYDATLEEFSRNISLAELYEFTEPFANLSGDGDTTTWNVAAHFRNDDWAFGLSYRNDASIDIDGRFAVSNVPAGDLPSPPFPAGVSWASQLATMPAAGVLDLPAIWQVGFAWLGTENWEFELDFQMISWSDFQRLPVDLADRTLLMDDFVVREDWKDTTTVRLGGSYTFNEQHQLRFGIYTDETAVPTHRLRPSIPDSDRVGYTLGYGFTSASKKFGLDFYWLRIEADTVSTGPSDFDGDVSAMLDEGVLWGTYETSIDLVGLTANWRFGD
ncbi:MAG: outer membrane protein transport protein [Acidobacteriota bacterium]|nr:outer membrane protein transport protein [Acidobacteriota bacterium]